MENRVSEKKGLTPRDPTTARSGDDVILIGDNYTFSTLHQGVDAGTLGADNGANGAHGHIAGGVEWHLEHFRIIAKRNEYILFDLLSWCWLLWWWCWRF